MSIQCLCNSKPYSLSSYRNHTKTQGHQNWLERNPTIISPVIITCLCGDTYDFEMQWRHLDASKKNSPHQTWQRSQLPSIINEVLVICYCGEVFKYSEFKLHKPLCSKRDRGKEIYQNSK